MTAYDVDQQQTYGARYFLLPGEEQIPNRIHVVGRSLVGGKDCRASFFDLRLTEAGTRYEKQREQCRQADGRQSVS